MKFIASALLLSTSLFLTGCVTGTRHLDNIQVPQHSSGKTAGGDVYIASILDSRKFEQSPSTPSTPSVKGNLSSTSKETLATLIGRQRNGYGAAMGDVALPNGVTIQDLTRKLLTEGLESRGYKVTDDPNAPHRVSVDVEKFWAWFSPGFVAVSFEANLQTRIEFQQGSTTKTIEVAGYGINKGQVASNENWELALRRAFEDFLSNLDKSLDQQNL